MRRERRPAGPRRPPRAVTTRIEGTPIDPTALRGRRGFAVGDRVRIAGTGLYSGEAGVIERLGGSVVPTALVRIASGRSRDVRTIDLEPLSVDS